MTAVTTMDIVHRIGIRSRTAEDVYRALTTLEGLSGWWTQDTTGDPTLGGTVCFRFDAGGFDMRVVEAVAPTHVRWVVVDGPIEWLGTTIDWQISLEADYAIVLFAHSGWREPVPFMHHCSTKWATFLLSLKQLLETGRGAPAPDDVKVSNWH